MSSDYINPTQLLLRNKIAIQYVHVHGNNAHEISNTQDLYENSQYSGYSINSCLPHTNIYSSTRIFVNLSLCDDFHNFIWLPVSKKVKQLLEPCTTRKRKGVQPIINFFLKEEAVILSIIFDLINYTYNI